MMAQMADPSRPAYPPPQDYPNYPPQPSPQRQDAPRDDNRSSYPAPPDGSRQGQYPPAPQPYPPPQQWAGHPQGQQPYPPHPPPGHYDPHHAQYHYPPPPSQPNQQAMHPDPYRLPPLYPYYQQPYQNPPAPAPRQRTAIACKYCRKRKIRCSGYDNSPDGRCQNCVRFNQQCLFHPVSSQAAFVPASALYGPNGPNSRAPIAGQDGQPGQNGQPQPMLYGAHGQPLGPAGPGGQPQYSYPPPPQNAQPHPQQGYPPAQYPGYPPAYPHGPPPANGHHAPPHYDQNAQYPQAPPTTATNDRSDRGSLKRGPPDDESEVHGNSQSPHPNSRPRHSAVYDGRPNSSFEYQNPTSPANSTMSYQSSYPPPNYSNGNQAVKSNNSPPAGLTPNSIHSLNSPRSATLDSRTPPPIQPGSAGSSQNGNGRGNMKVHEMLSNPNHMTHGREQRGKNDNEMLSKLDGKK